VVAAAADSGGWRRLPVTPLLLLRWLRLGPRLWWEVLLQAHSRYCYGEAAAAQGHDPSAAAAAAAIRKVVPAGGGALLSAAQAGSCSKLQQQLPLQEWLQLQYDCLAACEQLCLDVAGCCTGCRTG
jgi:hypothetical protein